MKIAIMQPYFIPYIGYFQLINAVDKFVVYDNIEYTKKGWINRNRILVNGKDEYISLPLKKDSDFSHINQRFLIETFANEKEKIQRRIKASYMKAPFFKEGEIIINNIFKCEDLNLFNFIWNSLIIICDYLEIKTELIKSSTIDINHSLKSQDKIIAICQELNGIEYLNPIGGINLYQSTLFHEKGFKLFFLKSEDFKYNQFHHQFVDSLSILDIVMFNSSEIIKSQFLKNYKLITS